MTRALDDLLNDSARAPRTELDVAELWRRGRARRRRKQLGTAVAAMAVLGVVGGVVLGGPAVRLAPAPIGDQPSQPTTAPAFYDRSVELASDVAPLEGTVEITERFAPPPGARAARDDEVLPPKDGAGENPCCLVVHPSGPALVDGQQRMLRVYPGVHSVGYGRTRLDVVSAAVLDSGAVALLGDRPAGRSLVVLPLAELPDLAQASGPFFEPPVERVDIPDDADAVAAGRGGFWVHAPDGWTRVTDEDGVGIDAEGVADRLVLRDGSAVDAEEQADGSAVLHQQAEEFTLRLELTVPGRRVSIQRIEAAGGPAPHTLLIVLRVDGDGEPEHRLLGISADTHVDYGTLAPGDTWTERLAITSSGELYHLHSDDAGVTVTRYTADLTRLAAARECRGERGSVTDVDSEPDWRRYADYRPWTDREGCLLRIDVVAERAGPGHCGWEDADVLIVGNPLGQPYTSAEDSVQFIRDPTAVFGDPDMAAGYEPDASVPHEAVDSGFRRNGVGLWYVPGDQSAVWLISEDTAERWPRGDPPVCS